MHRRIETSKKRGDVGEVEGMSLRKTLEKMRRKRKEKNKNVVVEEGKEER